MLFGPRTEAAVRFLTNPANHLLHARRPCHEPGHWAVHLHECHEDHLHLPKAGVVPTMLDHVWLTGLQAVVLFAAVTAASSQGPDEGQTVPRGHHPNWRMVTPGEIIDSPRSCNCRWKIGARLHMHSREVIRPSVRRLEGLGTCRCGTISMASQAAFGQHFSGHRCTRYSCPSGTLLTPRPCPHSLSGWQRRRRPLAHGSNPR